MLLKLIGYLGKYSHEIFSFNIVFHRRSLPFNQTLHLINSWNENKPVKIGRDGQVRSKLCRVNRRILLFARISNHVVLKPYVVYFQLIQQLT